MSSESQYLRPERRREKREATSGQVTLTFEDTNATVPGVLMDISPGGFRIKHTYQEISLNQVALVHYGDGERRARVAWNRRLGGEIESGFMVID
jgi:PilZ domain